MRWPFRRQTEKRALPYTDSVTALIIRQAAGTSIPSGMAGLTAYAEMASGAWARAGMAANVSPDDAPSVISPAWLAGAFRDMVLVGEHLSLIVVDRNGLRLDPIGSRDVKGDSPDPNRWTYSVSRETPNGTVTSTVSAEQVIHLKYSTDPKRPWRGVGPLERAGETSELLSALSVRMRQEAGAVSAVVIPDPTNPDNADDGDDRPDPTQVLAADMVAAQGGLLFAQTQMGGHGDRGNAPQSDWGAKRVGSMILEHYPALLEKAGMAVCNAMGLPPGLVGSQADGTNQREAWRRWAHGSVGPVARLVEEEVAAKLERAARARLLQAVRLRCRGPGLQLQAARGFRNAPRAGCRHQRHPRHGILAGVPPGAGCPGRGRRLPGGSEGGRSIPLARAQCSTLRGLALDR